MNDPQTEIDSIEELETAWSQAEMGADTGTLEAISTADFALVGPLGFVLDKQQWLERYRSGDLVTGSLSLDDPVIRVYGEAAVTIARATSSGRRYKGEPADGQVPHHAHRRASRPPLAARRHPPQPHRRASAVYAASRAESPRGDATYRSKRTMSARADDRAGDLCCAIPTWPARSRSSPAGRGESAQPPPARWRPTASTWPSSAGTRRR